MQHKPFQGETLALSMSDFPKGGDIGATRAWLDKEGFNGLFVGWKADSVWGLELPHIASLVGSQAEGLRLWRLLNIPGQPQSGQNFSPRLNDHHLFSVLTSFLL